MLKLFTMIISLLASSLTGPFMTQSQAASNDNLGRLFSRPNERNNLDNLRKNQKLKTVSPQPDAMVEVAPAALPDPISLQGYVKRSDGTKSTLWINNQAVQEDSTLDNVQIGRLNQHGKTNQTTKMKDGADSLDIKIPANGKHIRLKAGQVYEPETNQIKEFKTVEKEKRLNLEEGAIGDDSSDASVSKP